MPNKMPINFDEVIDRTNTESVKWNKQFLKQQFGDSDLLPLWVADTDFKSPQVVIDKLLERINHGIYGYCTNPEGYYDSIINWTNRRYDWSIEKEWISYSPGIVPACYFIIQRFTKPGDGVIIQPPVYYPFRAGIENNGRKVLNNQLLYEDKTYKFDFDDFEKKIKKQRTKLFILCSPHNPVGRVWTEKELRKLGDICLENKILIISDEIHCDLIYTPNKHTVFAGINDEYADNTITTMAGTKTFNLAGFHHSNVIIQNEDIKKEFDHQARNHGLTHPNVLGPLALMTSYNEGEPWLEEQLKYMYNNYLYLKREIEESLPNVDIIDIEGTYLAWLDFGSYGLENKDLEKKMREKAKVALDEGYIFGPGGDGFERINFGCPRKTLELALNQIIEVFKEI